MSKNSQNWLSKTLLVVAAALLLGSLKLPYWRVRVIAPQYPKGLQVIAYANRSEGDVQEIDGLNHYIGMKRLEYAAQFERRFALPAMYTMCALLLAAGFVPRRWAIVLAVPAMLFPLVFAGDLYFWLRHYGLHLDPHAPIRLNPFVPPLFGTGKIAQFEANAVFLSGYALAVAASLLSIAGALLRTTRAQPVAAVSHSPVAVAAALLIVAMPATAFCDLAGDIRNARDGDTIVVRGGVHRGPLVVDKSVKLVGENNPVLDGGGHGTVLTLNATGVVVRGFCIRNSGDTLSLEDAGILAAAPKCVIENNRITDVLFGVYLRQAPDCVIRYNELAGKRLPVPRRGDLIRIWYSNGVTVEGNRLLGGRDAVLWFSKHLTVRDNEARQGRYGLHFMYCDDAIVESNRLSENSVGAYLMYSSRLHLRRNWIVNNRGPSGCGLGLKDMDGADIRGNLLGDNRTGIFMDGALHGTVAGNLIARNDIGIFSVPSAYDNEITGNSFVDNGEQVALEAAASANANRWQGNFWSDYAGYDANGDGIGDVPYRVSRLFERLTERQSALRLFTYSPSVQALDFAARSFPIFAPEPKLTDPAPRMSAMLPPVQARVARSVLWWPVSLGMMLSVVVLTRPRVCRSVAEASASAAAHAAATVSVRNLTKRYGAHTAADDVSFTVARGETVALWGANGAGKTTILRCLLGIAQFDGVVRVLGLQGKEARRQIGYVPQDVRLHGDLTVRETLRFYAELRKVAPSEKLLEQWRLLDVADKPVRALSGGMRQRLAVAIALLSDPPVMLLDEPTSNLDRQSRAELRALLQQLKATGKTLIVSLHRAEEVRQLADRVIVLECGRKIAEGAPNGLADFLIESEEEVA